MVLKGRPAHGMKPGRGWTDKIEPHVRYNVGVDVGLRRDPTSIAAPRREVRTPVMETVMTLEEVRTLKLLTPYAEVTRVVEELLGGACLGFLSEYWSTSVDPSVPRCKTEMWVSFEPSTSARTRSVGSGTVIAMQEDPVFSHSGPVRKSVDGRLLRIGTQKPLRPGSSRLAGGRTIRAAPFTNPWSLSRDGEKQPPANVDGAHCWRFRWDSARNGETRKCRNYRQLGSCRRRVVEGRNGMDPRSPASRGAGGPAADSGVSSTASPFAVAGPRRSPLCGRAVVWWM